jgi:hypothetical protein
VSRTALSTRRPERLGEDGGDLVLRQVARALASSLDQLRATVVTGNAADFADLGVPVVDWTVG